MAKTLVQLDNKIRVKYLVKPKKYLLFYGNSQVIINDEYQNGVNTLKEAEDMGNSLVLSYFRGKMYGKIDKGE